MEKLVLVCYPNCCCPSCTGRSGGREEREEGREGRWGARVQVTARIMFGHEEAIRGLTKEREERRGRS